MLFNSVENRTKISPDLTYILVKLLKIYTGMKNLSDGNGRTKEVLNVWTTF